MRPNLYASRALLVVPGILFVCAILAQLNVYDAISKPVIWGCFGLALVFAGVPLLANLSSTFRRRPVVKYLLLGDSLMLTLILCAVLNIHATLALTLPMILACIYYQPKLVCISWCASCVVCLLAAPLAYLLDTYSAIYLKGYLEITCRVTAELLPRLHVNTLTDIGQILLFLTLPQFITLFGFGFLFLSIARHGEKSLRMQMQVIEDNTIDTLTGLYTRRYFLSQADRLMKASPETQGIMIVTDIDRFRLYNDRFGHKAGDDLLKAAADSLRRYVGQKGICGRLSDDHMAVLLNKACYDKQSFTDCVLALPPSPGSGSYGTFMIAGCCETDGQTDATTLCDRAFAACSAGKGHYGIGVIPYSGEMHIAAIRKQQLTDEIALALKQEAFEPYLQPQCAPDGTLLGAEALARWCKPGQAVVTPDGFIPLCEATGMVADLDRLIWRKACQQLRTWRDAGLRLPYISLNLSPTSLYRMDVCEELICLLGRYKLAPEDLHLEITETAIAKDVLRLKPIIGRLRSRGFRVEMDDFGSGTSSLGMLQNLYVDALKLDYSFLQGMLDGDRGTVILRKVVELANELGIGLIAEGAETQEQVDLLTGMGVQVFQGYHFSRPLPAGAFCQQYLK